MGIKECFSKFSKIVENKKFGRIPVIAYDSYLYGIRYAAKKMNISYEKAAEDLIRDANSSGSHEHVDLIRAALAHLIEERDKKQY
jgi:hypothetical protein